METRIIKIPRNKLGLVIPSETESKEANSSFEKFWEHTVRRLSMAPRELSKLNPDSYGLPYEEVTFHSRDGLRLSGWYMPTKNSPATIIVAHGYRKSKASYLEYAQWLKWAGYSVFIFDFRGHGYSEGPYGTSIGYMERLDLHGAVDFLRSRGVTQIGLIGVSMGAAAALLAAGENPYIRAVIADSSYSQLYRSITTQASAILHIPRWTSVPLAKIAAQAMANHHGYDAEQAHPVDAISRVLPRPVFIIHGEADTLTEIINARILHEQSQGQALLWTAPGVEHALVYKAMPEQYRQQITAFFDTVNWQAALQPISLAQPIQPAPYMAQPPVPAVQNQPVAPSNYPFPPNYTTRPSFG